MPRYKMYLEYEGTRYSGWQKQPGSRTIQGELLKAAEQIFQGNIDVQGSGRTDSGVNAMNQVAHLDANTMLAPEIIKMKMNDLLPSDINIKEVEKTNNKFHARHSAVARSYVYCISKRRTAFGKNYVWWIKDKLDVSAMQGAVREFIGMHNFQSFADKDEVEKSTKVLIESVEIMEQGDLILIRIKGSHFLWKMVRRMVGVIAEVGRGKMRGSDIKDFLKNRSNEPAKYTAPPSGLFLEQILYEGDEFKDEFLIPIQVLEFARKNSHRR